MRIALITFIGGIFIGYILSQVNQEKVIWTAYQLGQQDLLVEIIDGGEIKVASR